MYALKRLLLNTLLLPGFPASLRYVQQDCATIFMLHRFLDDEGEIDDGCDTAHLRRGLDYLARNGYEFVSLFELFERLERGRKRARGAVAFTIDDGYFDQAIIAAPVFAEFDCPVTTFVSTGFLDGELWFWWDQIEYLFANAAGQSVQLRVGEDVVGYQWETQEQRVTAQMDFTEKCKLIPDDEKWKAIAELAAAAGVDIPAHPPRRFAPMTWDELRACEDMGMTFGPHTVTHPVLSRTSDESAHFEISESWRRLGSEARNAVPIFCYPNGGWSDFGDREVSIMRRVGLRGAVVGEPGYANALKFQSGDAQRFKVERFAFPDDLAHMVQYVSGLERFKQILRGDA